MYLKENKIKRVRPNLEMTIEFFVYIVYKEKPDLLSYNFLIKNLTNVEHFHPNYAFFFDGVFGGPNESPSWNDNL